MRRSDPDDVVDESKLRRALARLGISQRAAAERIGMTRDRFYDIAVSGRTRPPSGFRARVEMALGLGDGALRF
jgi:hypothetical protein